MTAIALRRTSMSSGSSAGRAAIVASGSISSIKNCSRTSALNSASGKAGMCSWARRMRRTASKPRSSTAARGIPT